MNKYAKGYHVLKALDHPIRLKIIKLLDKKDMYVNEIMFALREERLLQPAVSTHLKWLRDAGFINIYKIDKRKYHKLNYNRFEQVTGLLKKFSE